MRTTVSWTFLISTAPPPPHAEAPEAPEPPKSSCRGVRCGGLVKGRLGMPRMRHQLDGEEHVARKCWRGVGAMACGEGLPTTHLIPVDESDPGKGDLVGIVRFPAND